MKTKLFDAGDVFSGKTSGKPVMGWDQPNEHTPTSDPNYIFPTWVSDIVVWMLNSKEPLYIFGPTGAGKTSCLKQTVRKLNYPVHEVTGHNRLEFPELVGHHTVQQGSMQYELGPLSLAMRDGGVFLFNEIDLVDAATLAGLNSILDGSPLTIPEAGGLVIKPHPMFRFVATANTSGGGDATGLYQGAMRLNLAFQDRFQYVKADYIPPEAEKQIVIKQVPTLPEALVDKMVQYANAVRRLFIGEEAEGVDETIEITMSTRSLLRWAHLMVQYESLKSMKVDVVEYTLERALLHRASGVTKVTLKELKNRFF